MLILYLTLIFSLGLFVGSFLNCLIYRISQKESFLRGRSYCPKCKHKLSWYDLIPLLSFFILKGKCRYCQEKISLQYPLVEIATAILFVLTINYKLLTINFESLLFTVYSLLLICFLIIIFVYDLKHFIIPDKVVFPAIGITFIYNSIFNFQFSIFNLFPAAFLAAVFFLIIFLISRGKWLGFGDVKLAFFMGFLLGFPNILVSLFLAFSVGAIIGIGLIISGKKNLKSEIPFGPFLVIGTLISLFFGQNLINWYLNLFIL